MKTTKYSFTVKGSVRGRVSEGHRKLSGAIRSMSKDDRACARLGGGAYSDAHIYLVDHETGDEYWVDGSYSRETGFVLPDLPFAPDAIMRELEKRGAI